MRQILKACCLVFGVSIEQLKVILARAGDVEEICRSLLTHRPSDGVLEPGCVFGNILERCEPEVMRKLSELLDKHWRLVKGLVTKKARKRAIVLQGRRFFKKAAKFMFRRGRINPETASAHCYVHGRRCRLLPCGTAGEGEAASPPLNLFIAGVICHAWSSMGTQRCWLADSAKPFLQTLSEVLASDFAAAILECTAAFDSEVGLSPFAQDWHRCVLQFSPTLLGYPCSRPRLCMLLLKKSKLRWHPEVAALGFQESFSLLFARSLAMNGNAFVRAPPDEVATAIEELALGRGFPMARGGGRQWKCDHVLPIPMRRRLLRHRCGPARQHVAWPDVFCNLRQTPSYAALSTVIPTLLRGSRIYSFRFKRILIERETMEAMGYGMFSEPKASFADELANLSPADVRGLAGNGMHAAAVGAAMIFCSCALSLWCSRCARNSMQKTSTHS